jgi:hypothetical protein
MSDIHPRVDVPLFGSVVHTAQHLLGASEIGIAALEVRSMEIKVTSPAASSAKLRRRLIKDQFRIRTDKFTLSDREIEELR